LSSVGYFGGFGFRNFRLTWQNGNAGVNVQRGDQHEKRGHAQAELDYKTRQIELKEIN